MDLSFPSIERHGNKMDQLDENKKKDIENVLNEEFCSLDVELQAQSKICSIQNLDFRVQKRISCGTFSIFLTFFVVHDSSSCKCKKF